MDYIENKDFYEALNNYFKLKSTYDNSYEKEKSRLIKDKDMSWREKRLEFKKLKPKCVNCKRPVGTRFTRNYNEQEMATYLKALCGDIASPCNLNIELKLTEGLLYTDIIKDLQKSIENNKNEIIENKNKLIFEYIKSEDAVGIFDKIKETIKDNSEILAFYLEQYLNIVDNKEEHDKLKENLEKSYIMINDIKKLIADYDERNINNTQIMNDVVGVYVNQLSPLLKEIRELKYKKNIVEYNPDTNKYYLIQEKYTVADITVHPANPVIVSYVYGVVNKGKSTKKNRDEKDITTNKTRKQRKQELIIEEDNKPIINPADGSVSWDNPEYQNIWKTLSEKYRKVLSKDKEWLEKTMNTFVENKKNNKPNEFVSPDNLILPPKVDEKGTYDFGNNIYNEIINKLPKIQKDVIISMEPNVNLMENAINSIVSSELGFRKL